MYTLHLGNSKDVLKSIATNSVDSIITDPPYEIGFMGKAWDKSGIAYDEELWQECLRVLKPGGYMCAFGATKSYHRMAVAIEDAGFTIRDTLFWIYGTGYPKGIDIAKWFDKDNGIHRGKCGALQSTNGSMEGGNFARTPKGEAVSDEAKQWEGWWSTLKPATEPIVLAQKPISTTIIKNIREHGVGALNIDACRFGEESRYPSNVLIDSTIIESSANDQMRYFYSAKASKSEREFGLSTLDDGTRQVYNGAEDGAVGGMKVAKNVHPTVKPIQVMKWLCRLVTPKGGTILDPFMGSGTTGVAANTQGFDFIGIELSPEYLQIANLRIDAWK